MFTLLSKVFFIGAIIHWVSDKLYKKGYNKGYDDGKWDTEFDAGKN